MPPFFASLPESLWADVNRRLRAEPSLWALTANPNVLAAFSKLGGDLPLWRPGQLGLTALALYQPECASDPMVWLNATGRNQLAAAYTWVAEGASPDDRSFNDLPEFLRATLAAVALHRQLNTDDDYANLAASALEAPHRYVLPLNCLYGLLPSPAALTHALIHNGATELAHIAARIWVSNETVEDLRRIVPAAVRAQPMATQLAVAGGLAAFGLADVVRVAPAHEAGEKKISRKARRTATDTLPEKFRQLADALEENLLAQTTGGNGVAAMGRTTERAQSLAADVAIAFGQAALAKGDSVSALAAFEDARSLRPYDDSIQPYIAEAALASHNIQAARHALSQTPKTQVKNAKAILLAARVAHRTGNSGQAREEALALAHTLSPDQPEALLAANLLAELGERGVALQLLHRWVAQHPADASSYNHLAAHYIANGKPEVALEFAWHAVGIAPNTAQYRQTLAQALTACGKHIEAAGAWGRASELTGDLSLYPQWAEALLLAGEPIRTLEIAKTLLEHPEARGIVAGGVAHILAGRAMDALGDTDGAYRHFNEATSLAPHSALPWQAVADYHRGRGDLDRAMAALDAGQQAMGASAAAAQLLSQLADLHLQLNHPADALLALQSAVSMSPDQPELHAKLGALYRATNRLPAAIDCLRQAAALTPSQSTYWHALGQALEAAIKLEEALATYQHAQALGGDAVELNADLGRLAYQLGKEATAQTALEAALLQQQARPALDHDRLIDVLTLLGAIYEQRGLHNKALEVYRHAIVVAPERGDITLQLGVCLLEIDQPEAAIATLKDIAERDLDNLRLQKTIARAYARAQLWIESLLAYEQAARLAPDDHTLWHEVAMQAAKAGKPHRAIEAFETAVGIAPDNATLRQHYAELLIAQNRLEAARDMYAAASQLQPASLPILLGLGQVHLMLHQVRDAALVFERVVAIDPSHAEAWHALGEARLALHQPQSAFEAFNKAGVVEPANPAHLRRAGECQLLLGQQTKAVAIWQKALVSHPADADIHALLGKALAQKGRHADALDMIERAVINAPGNAQFALEAARIAFSLGDSHKAHAHLQHAVQLKPNDPEVWHLLGKACQELGMSKNAAQAYQQTIKIAPSHGAAHAALARLHAHAGVTVKALAEADLALQHAPDIPEVLSDIADVYMHAGKHLQAIELMRKVASAKPADCAAHLSLARSLTLAAETGLALALNQKEVRDLILHSLERAAALNADPADVREWAGRARAIFGDAAEAIPLLEATAAARPSSEAYRALAECYLRIGQPDRARQAIEAAIDRAPNVADNHITLGRICLQLDDAHGARAALQAAAGLDHRSALARYWLAKAQWQLGEYGDAIGSMGQAISLDADQPAWQYEFARWLSQLNKHEKALGHYQRAVQLAAEQQLPAQPTATFTAALGEALLHNGDLGGAQRQFEKAVSLLPDEVGWRLTLGDIYNRQRQHERAYEQFSKVIGAMPKHVGAHIGAARAAAALGNVERATDHSASALKVKPDDAAALTAHAEVRAAAGDFAGALGAYKKAAQIASDPLPILLAQANVLCSMGEPLKAVAALKRAAEAAPDHDTVIGALGDALADCNRTDDAIKAYQRALTIAPSNVVHMCRLGSLYRRLGQLDVALGILQEARELEPNNPAILRELGQVFEERRQYDRALTLYEALLAIEPDNADNYFRAGIALKSLRDYAQAARHFQRASELDPSNVEADRLRLAVSALGIFSGSD